MPVFANDDEAQRHRAWRLLTNDWFVRRYAAEHPPYRRRRLPRGTQHILVGLLVADNRGRLTLRVDGGGEWRLDAGDAASFIGLRVRVEGMRSGFDLLDVRHIGSVG